LTLDYPPVYIDPVTHTTITLIGVGGFGAYCVAAMALLRKLVGSEPIR